MRDPHAFLSRRALLLGGLAAPWILAAPPRRSAAATLDAAAFSPPADAGDDGSGTDASDALQAFLDEIARTGASHARIPPGRYRLTRPLLLVAPTLADLTVDATGAEFVFDIPEPRKNRPYLRIANPARTGRRLALTGLTARLARPTVRTSGSDMVRLTGFHDYAVTGLAIPSADNMGLTIGRGDPQGWTPDRIVVDGCSFGGRREATPHSHGSIGDTAVWIVTPAAETRVSACRIRETGDDGIYVGHSHSTTIRRVTIRDNTLSDTGVGIGVSVPHAEIVGNRIDRTNVCAIRCEAQNGNQGSDALIRGNHIRRAGQLEAGDIAEKIIAKPHPHAILIHEPIGRVAIVDNRIEETRECALVVLSHKDGACADIRVDGGRYERIGVDRAGRPRAPDSRIAVFRRGGAFGSVSRFYVDDPTIADTVHTLLSWTASGIEADKDISIKNAMLINCNILDAPLVRINSQLSSFPIEIKITYKTENSKINYEYEGSENDKASISFAKIK